jgi:3-methylfumaryl-CoA hydratase
LTADIGELAKWIGRVETVEQTVSPDQVAMLSATLDRERPPLPGEPLPLLWHWIHALPIHRQSQLGADGHPRRGVFLPPIPLERRMWAGSRVRFLAPLRVGGTLSRVSTIKNITTKAGRSGPLFFVNVEHRIGGPDGPAIEEEQDIVYRDFPEPGEPAAPATSLSDESCDWSETLTPDTVLLFRYSAAMFNGHRIHYDRDYAVKVEGYPGLVVPGPLTATLAMEAFRRQLPGPVETFSFRGVKPLFDGNPITLRGRAAEAEGTHHVWALDRKGDIAMQAEVRLAR